MHSCVLKPLQQDAYTLKSLRAVGVEIMGPCVLHACARSEDAGLRPVDASGGPSSRYSFPSR